ncbi:lipocalin family protein [Pontibacter sp. MBLB2868]|uniref:lipocalin family protein n=1 Tax=Pontibacter sp. MBLB2868 TaxID=3451555 RepID=UPI003F74FDF8
MKTIVLFTALIVYSLISILPQQSSDALIGTWKLTRSEALEKIKSSPQYASMPAAQRKAFEDQSSLMLKVCQYDFKPDNHLVYMDVDRSFAGAYFPVERHATWELEGDILTIKETDRPFERQMKIVTLNDSTLVVNLIMNGVVSEGAVAFKALK